jgi:hypothetical protein
MKTQSILLAASVLANVVLVVLLVLGGGSDETRRDAAAKELCNKVEKDLNFFIEGLERDKDAFYSPLVVRTLEHAIRYCEPSMADELETRMHFLRQQLVYLVAQNVSPERKKTAHDEALKSFRELKEQFSK